MGKGVGTSYLHNWSLFRDDKAGPAQETDGTGALERRPTSYCYMYRLS